MKGGPGRDDDAREAAPEPRWRRHLVWAAVAAAYLVVFPYFAKVNNPNENVRVWATRALATQGTFAIEGVEAAWGEVGDRAGVGGRRYSSKAPGTTLLGVPVHFVHDRLAVALTGRPPSPAATTWVLRVLTVCAPLALFLLWFGRRVEAETGSPWARDLLTLGLGLGTMLYPYGLAFVGHAQSAALLFGGFLLIVPAATPRRLAAGGALTALAVVFEYQALFGAAVVAAFGVWQHRRRALPLLAGALPPALLLGAYHTALFGRPWSLPYAHLDDAAFQTYHHGAGFLGLGWPRLGVVRAALLEPDYGLFIFSPFLLAGVASAFVLARRRQAQAVAVLAVFGVMVLFLAGMTNWRGGWCAGGPRYIAVVVPFLAWAIALGWRQEIAPRLWALTAVAGLVLASVILCGLSGALFPHFPLQFDNPIFDLALPLLAAGYAPHGLGTVLGLRGLAALAPLGLAFAVALGAALVRPLWSLRRGLALAAAGVVALAVLLPLSRYGRRRRPEEAHPMDYVRNVWEPPVAAGGGRGSL